MSAVASQTLGPEVLLIFLGHSSDADALADVIYDLERELQRLLDQHLSVSAELPFKSVRIWEWRKDGLPVVGGQDQVVAEAIKRANIAVFVFKEKIGTVSWEELNQSRNRENPAIPVLAFFPTDSPPDLNDEDRIAKWLDLVKKRGELGRDWSALNSKALRPMEKYKDAAHLTTLAVEQLSNAVVSLLKCEPATKDSVPAYVLPTKFLGDHSHLSYDRRPVLTRSLDELDQDLLKESLAKPLSQDLNADLKRGRDGSGPTVSEQLENLGCLYANRPTLGALLCFAPTQSLTDKSGCCTLQMAIHNGSERGGERAQQSSARGNLLLLYKKGMSWLTGGAVLRRRGQIGTDTRDDLEIPEIVLREALANALIHRDYESKVLQDQPTRIDVYPDKVEISSYGLLLKEVPIELLNSSNQSLRPFRRNPVIAGVFQCMTLAELNASGVQRMRRVMSSGGLAFPLFRTSGGFVCVTLARPFELSNSREPVQSALVPSRITRKAFISSTSELAEHREAARDACLRAGVIPIMWEALSIAGADTATALNEMFDDSDLCIFILGNRYGSASARDGISFMELEFAHASERGLPVLAFTMHKDHPVTADAVEIDVKGREELVRLKERLTRQRLWVEFKSPEELRCRLLDALASMPAPPANFVGRKAASPLRPLDADIRDYRRKVEAMYAKLPAAGFATQLKIPIALDDLYVPLRATVNLGFIEGEVWASAEDAEKRLGHCREATELDLDTAFAEAARRHMPGLAILGDPGSGKTMHLQRLLLRCLRAPETLGLSAGMLPIFLPLRELQDLEHGLDCFIQQQLAKPHLGAPKDFGARLLERGNLLFLLDGLDEVAEPSRRREVAQWIEQAAGVSADCRFAVTCRYAGYTSEVRLGALFLELHIRPLSAPQADELVRRWYGIVEKGLATDAAAVEVSAIVAREKADELIGLLHGPDFRARRVFELTRNPLLLINICLVHRWRNQLPKGRARLYRECTDVLLEHWQGSKQLQLGLEAEQSRLVLQPVAWWLHQKERRTRATAADLEPVLAPALAAVKWSGGSARDFLHRVRDVSGLLTGWDHEHFGFMHLGFQEYLAARDIRARAYADASALRELAGHFGESWWQEVTLLLLALEEPSLFVAFMRELVKLPAFAAHPDLVEACLDDAAEVSGLPFVELLRLPAGLDKGLWLRQVLALRLVQRLEPTALEGLAPALAAHPSAEIRALVGATLGDRGRDTLVATRGGYELVRIPAGNFLMGSPSTEGGRYDDEGPVRRVCVPEFHLGRYPVTNEQYARFLEANPRVAPPAYWDNRQCNQPRQPAVGVSWHDAMAYAAWAGLRLPSEAEWEYACRAGTTTRYCTGDAESDLARAGWYGGNSGEKLHAVGEKAANAWGLYDMHGNVWEWCADHGHQNYKGAPVDGSAWVDSDAEEGADRVGRGGGWINFAGSCRSACRSRRGPSIRDSFLGFRLVLAPSSTNGPVPSLEPGKSARRAGEVEPGNEPEAASAERGPGGAGMPATGEDARRRAAARKAAEGDTAP